MVDPLKCRGYRQTQQGIFHRPMRGENLVLDGPSSWFRPFYGRDRAVEKSFYDLLECWMAERGVADLSV